MSIKLKGDKEISKVLTIKQKALQINLNEHIYGTFAEIGLDKKLSVIFLDLVVHQEL